ncbi:1,4-dihydroxy-2-naphthoate polyprenyltransferase [Sutcliffiella sp. NPDC057660]|uniref:1,4-dihydroxy-2-naphthoate polyprenyltransferase n=1 Tax=Sutcliffiella sp. NPDC057660 TaxID=3346199 RepID=UPI0036D1F997
MQPQTISSQPGIQSPSEKRWKVWWNLLRPHTLTAAFVPVFIGTSLALYETVIDWPMFLAMLLASLLIQAATNMINEYYDFRKGLDNENSVGIGGAIVRHGVKPQTVLQLAFIFFGIATLLGVYICLNSTWWLAAIGTACMAAGYFYTGGPYPIAYTPFGEIVAGFFMGFVIILISFYIQTGTVSSTSMLISIPISILVGAILLANNIRDIVGDKENGRKTVAILIGRKNAITLLAAMFIISYTLIVLFIALDYASVWSLLVFLSIVKPLSAIKGFSNNKSNVTMMPAMVATAQTNTIFGFLLGIGLVIGYFV